MNKQENENIVEVRNVYMRFNLSKEKVDNLKEYVIKLIKHQLLFNEFYALRNVSFSIRKGESFAIIGENGCGKSTLLKVISGIFYPSSGSVSVHGTIAPLIELGAGFDMDLTARENIFLNGAVLGYSTKFMEQHFKEIMDFAELWDFVDVPVKNFSSGMVARLGFAIATMVVPDILIVDEILSVGDFMFQQKCEQKMQEMIDKGATLIFVSHNTDQVKKLCKKAIWLKHGITQMIGPSKEVCDAYVHDMQTGGKGLVQVEDIAKEPKGESVSVSLDSGEHRQFKFITLLRALAACMVVWDHLGPFRFPNWRPAQIINNILNRPLGIIQYFGAFGVILFFLISGFLIPHGIPTGSRKKFAIKRTIKIFPPLITSFLGFYIVQKVVSIITGSPTYWSQFTPKQWVTNATLINYFLGQPDVVNGVTWFLFPELIFYVLCFVFYILLKKKPKISIIIFQLTIAAIYLIPSHMQISSTSFSILSSSWYIVFPMFGMLLYYVWSGKIDFKFFFLFSGINYYVMIKCMVLFNPQYYEKTPYAISFMYAYAIFIIALLLDEKIRTSKITNFISKISYSLYLTHMMYGGLIMELLIKYCAGIRYTLVFLITVIFTICIANFHYILVEKPLFRIFENKN